MWCTINRWIQSKDAIFLSIFAHFFSISLRFAFVCQWYRSCHTEIQHSKQPATTSSQLNWSVTRWIRFVNVKILLNISSVMMIMMLATFDWLPVAVYSNAELRSVCKSNNVVDCHGNAVPAPSWHHGTVHTRRSQILLTTTINIFINLWYLTDTSQSIALIYSMDFFNLFLFLSRFPFLFSQNCRRSTDRLQHSISIAGTGRERTMGENCAERNVHIAKSIETIVDVVVVKIYNNITIPINSLLISSRTNFDAFIVCAVCR